MAQANMWKYMTRSPRVTRLDEHSMHLPSGHRYGYIRRTHKLSTRVVEYKVICLCKWRDPTWHSNLRSAFLWADRLHYEELRKQPALFEEEGD